MSVGWDVKWCPVSRITTPLARKRPFHWIWRRVGSWGPRGKLQNFKIDHFLTNSRRRYMAETLPIWRETPSNQSIILCLCIVNACKTIFSIILKGEKMITVLIYKFSVERHVSILSPNVIHILVSRSIFVSSKAVFDTPFLSSVRYLWMSPSRSISSSSFWDRWATMPAPKESPNTFTAVRKRSLQQKS